MQLHFSCRQVLGLTMASADGGVNTGLLAAASHWLMEDRRLLLLLLMKDGFAFRPAGFLGGGSVIHPSLFGRH